MNELKKPKVVYFITKLELGGAQKVCLALFNSLKGDAFLISGQHGELAQEVVSNQNFIPLKNLGREVNFIKDLKAAWELYLQLRKLKKTYPNIILHTHSTKAGFMGRAVGLLAGIKHIVHTVHGFSFNPNQSWLAYYFCFFLELACPLFTSKIIFVSNSDLRRVESFKFVKKKALLIRAAVDFNKLLPKLKKSLEIRMQNRASGKFTIGTVACFKPQKNLFALISAFKELSKSISQDISLHLEIIGDGALRVALEEKIKNLGLENNVTLLGWQKNPADFMMRWNAFTLTSLWEGLPCSLVEARLLKIPAACYNVNGISEVLIDNENGFLIEPLKENLSEKRLAEKLKAIIENPELEQKFIDFEQNLEEFSQEKMVKQHKKLYAELQS